jgi:transketolase
MIPQQAREASSSALDQLAVNTIRTLAIDGVQKANSGHPGTPMGAAPTAYAIWQHALRYDPQNPWWPNRDRFVLSAGHASMLLYSLIHLAGIKAANPSYKGENRAAVTIDDLKTFRQEGSRCPGHPEYGWTTGVEATTGPLGQGLATSVGMAIAGKWLAANYNRPGFELFNFNAYALCGDGCMQEGVASEAASLAAHLKLSNLCWIYDSNRVTIEGHTDISFTEDVASRFLAYGWEVARVSDPNDVEHVDRALERFKRTNDRPTLIVVHSHIGYGAPHKQDTSAAHGEPLGPEEVRLTKEFFGFSPDESFVVPPEVREHFNNGIGARGAKLSKEWDEMFARYSAQYPDLAEQLKRMQTRDLPAGWEKALPTFPPSDKGISTRDASGKVLNAIAQAVPWLVGGSADLYPSTKTRLEFEFAGDFQAPSELGDYKGRNFHFGIREHAMMSIVNGMVLTGLRAYGSGFLIFTDYARGAIRLSSIMDIPALHIWTHDTICVGEDGPTHQPIEQLLSLRAIPGMMVIRPADANELVEGYRLALTSKERPYAIIGSRQPLPIYDRSKFGAASGVAKGGYILADAPGGKPDVILIGCGSEVGLCMSAWEKLSAEGVKARVVSMPCWRLFDAQDQAYRDSVLPPSVRARVTVEEASPIGWERYAGSDGVVLAMSTFGESAPMKVVMEHFGFTVEHVVSAAKETMKKAAN